MNADPKKPVNLTELGKKQALEVYEKLKEVPIEIIITSELPRAIQTAKIINKGRKIPIKIDSRINEIRSGMEGEIYDTYKEKQKELAKEKGVETREVRINDGESFNDLKERVAGFVEELKLQKYKIVLVVTHFDTIQGIDENINKEKSVLKPKSGQIIKFNL